ncbi:MAG: dihydrodipicolinate synthase family protein [Spirochaetia bacterium]
MTVRTIGDIPDKILDHLRKGMVIPASPLALHEDRSFDREHQCALMRYYTAAGAGGIAVGVHSTQFEIREPRYNLFKPVLAECSKFIDSAPGGGDILKIAGVCGKTSQAVQEAEYARDTGYHAGLLSLSAFSEAPDDEMIEHCRRIADIFPIFGFYLQPAVGGRILSRNFWNRFARIGNVLGVKAAPFNRYYTLEVMQGIASADPEGRIALYTGNDDNILVDLLTRFPVKTEGSADVRGFAGGLLGHWSVWTKRAVELIDLVHRIRGGSEENIQEILTLAAAVTDSNMAFFDAPNSYAGVLPGIHEVLRRQGLMKGIWCLNPDETLSTGQKEEIDRVYAAYPYLNDDDFVARNLNVWLTNIPK